MYQKRVLKTKFKKPLSMLSLFSGIGGLDIAAEMTGNIKTVAMCERDAFAARVLKYRWPHIAHFDNVKNINAKELEHHGITKIDIVAGGFPCQSFSRSNPNRSGLLSPKSLFPEMLRIVSELREIDPNNCKTILCENVEGFIDLGLDALQAELERLGYESSTFIYPAAAVGYPFKRYRTFVVAHRYGELWDSLSAGTPGTVCEEVPRNFSRGILAKLSVLPPTTRFSSQLDSFSANSIKCAGNAVVPGQAYPLFQAIVETERRIRRQQRIALLLNQNAYINF